jgi:hypothetical protein
MAFLKKSNVFTMRIVLPVDRDIALRILLIYCFCDLFLEDYIWFV